MLRGIAIVMVLLDHFVLFNGAIRHIPLSLSALTSTFHNLHLSGSEAVRHVSNPMFSGVNLFFVISGFVVVRSLKKNYKSVENFFLARVFRLYPALIFALFFASIATALVTNFPPKESSIPATYDATSEQIFNQAIAALNGTMINYQGYISYAYRILWSLSVEFQFYFVVTILLLVAQIANISKAMQFKLLLIGSILILLFAMMGRAFFAFGLGELSYISRNCFDFIAAGAVLAYLSESTIKKLSGISRYFPGLLLAAPLILLALTRENAFGKPTDLEYREGFCFFLMLLCFTGLVACASVESFKWSNTRLFRLLTAIGERSYTIYLIHSSCMLLAWLILALISKHLVSNVIVFGALEVAVSVAILAPLTEAIYQYVEKPFISIGKVFANSIDEKLARKNVAT